LAATELAAANTPVMYEEPAVVVSVPENPRAADPTKAEPVGAEVTRTTTVKVSALSVIGAVIVNGMLEVDPTAKVGRVPTEIAVGVIAPAALAGDTDVKTPKPKAATATSATRLKVVFVDICFLSISRVWEFPNLGFGRKVPSHMS